MVNRKPRKTKKTEYFISQACSADETLVMLTGLHWIFVAKGLAWFAALALLGVGADSAAGRMMLALHDAGSVGMSYMLFKMAEYIQLFLTTLGVIFFAVYLSAYLWTAVGLTSRRLIIRKGLMAVKVTSIDLEEVKGEYVDHGLFGRFFNYGEIHMDARFVENFHVPDIPDPYRLLRAMNEARSAAGDTVVAGEVPLQPVEPQAPPPVQIYVPVTPRRKPAAPSALTYDMPVQDGADAGVPSVVETFAVSAEPPPIQVIAETENYQIIKQRKF